MLPAHQFSGFWCHRTTYLPCPCVVNMLSQEILVKTCSWLTISVSLHLFQNVEKVLFLCFLVARGDRTLWAVKWPRFVVCGGEELVTMEINNHTLSALSQMHVTAGEQPSQESGYVQSLPAPAEPGYTPTVYSVDCEMVQETTPTIPLPPALTNNTQIYTACCFSRVIPPKGLS